MLPASLAGNALDSGPPHCGGFGAGDAVEEAEAAAPRTAPRALSSGPLLLPGFPPCCDVVLVEDLGGIAFDSMPLFWNGGSRDGRGIAAKMQDSSSAIKEEHLNPSLWSDTANERMLTKTMGARLNILPLLTLFPQLHFPSLMGSGSPPRSLRQSLLVSLIGSGTPSPLVEA